MSYVENGMGCLGVGCGGGKGQEAVLPCSTASWVWEQTVFPGAQRTPALHFHSTLQTYPKAFTSIPGLILIKCNLIFYDLYIRIKLVKCISIRKRILKILSICCIFKSGKKKMLHELMQGKYFLHFMYFVRYIKVSFQV